jgi:hypothetical protein
MGEHIRETETLQDDRPQTGSDDADRPDRRPPRGNQEVETVDVERGRENIDRVLGW